MRNVFALAAIANLELEEAELINRLRSTQEKQRLAYRCRHFDDVNPEPLMFILQQA